MLQFILEMPLSDLEPDRIMLRMDLCLPLLHPRLLSLLEFFGEDLMLLCGQSFNGSPLRGSHISHQSHRLADIQSHFARVNIWLRQQFPIKPSVETRDERCGLLILLNLNDSSINRTTSFPECPNWSEVKLGS
jgi:hypothetical protein